MIHYLTGDDLGLAEFDLDLLRAILSILADPCESGLVLLDLSPSSSESLLKPKKRRNIFYIQDYILLIKSLKSRINHKNAIFSYTVFYISYYYINFLYIISSVPII